MNKSSITRVLTIILFGLVGSHQELTTVAQDEFRIDRSTLESWIFQQAGDAGSGKRAMEAEINLRINRIEQYAELSDTQRRQLRLAAQGDVKRFYDQVEEVICKVEKMKLNQGNFNEAYQLTIPLQSTLRNGIFGPSSLFTKVSRSVISGEQRDRYEAAERNRLRLRGDAFLRAMIRKFGQEIPLTAKQHQQLFELASPGFAEPIVDYHYKELYTSIYVVNLPEDSLAMILDAEQLQELRKRREQMEPMRRFLKEQGLGELGIVEQGLGEQPTDTEQAEGDEE